MMNGRMKKSRCLKMLLNIVILASGSTWKFFLCGNTTKTFLIDAGLTGKKITSLLAEIDRKPEDLDAIFITHEHSDHTT